MSLDGLRAWIGEVERKLGARTRVFLVLLAIAIGGSGAAIYLALEADDGTSSTSGGASLEEVQQLRDQIELQDSAAQVSTLEAQIVELRTEVEALQGAGGKSSDSPESGLDESPKNAIPESEAK